MTTTNTTVNRNWIAREFSRGIEAERALQADAEETSAAPPATELGVLYHEIALADARHLATIEAIATRYGYNPSEHASHVLGETLSRLKQKVGELGSTPWQVVAHDLNAKANVIHWSTAWIQTFQSIGDLESARELAGLRTEEQAHRDALQEGLNRLVLRGASEPNP